MQFFLFQNPKCKKKINHYKYNKNYQFLKICWHIILQNILVDLWR